MPNLGFSMDADFKAKALPRRRVGTGIHDVDHLIEARRRAPVEIFIALAVMGAAAAALAFPDAAAMLAHRLALLL